MLYCACAIITMVGTSMPCSAARSLNCKPSIGVPVQLDVTLPTPVEDGEDSRLGELLRAGTPTREPEDRLEPLRATLELLPTPPL